MADASLEIVSVAGSASARDVPKVRANTAVRAPAAGPGCRVATVRLAGETGDSRRIIRTPPATIAMAAAAARGVHRRQGLLRGNASTPGVSGTRGVSAVSGAPD